VATKIGSYPELDPWSIIRILGVITPTFLPISFSHDYGIFSNISGIDLCGSGYRQIVICLHVKNILAKKIACFGCMLASG